MSPNRHILKLRPPFSFGLAHPPWMVRTLLASFQHHVVPWRIACCSRRQYCLSHLPPTHNDCPDCSGSLYTKRGANSTRIRYGEKTDIPENTRKRTSAADKASKCEATPSLQPTKHTASQGARNNTSPPPTCPSSGNSSTVLSPHEPTRLYPILHQPRN
jgi:hypothetical protein